MDDILLLFLIFFELLYLLAASNLKQDIKPRYQDFLNDPHLRERALDLALLLAAEDIREEEERFGDVAVLQEELEHEPLR